MGAFFYASSGDIWMIIKLIQMIKKFFGQDWALSGGAFPVPATPTVKFAETELWNGKFGSMLQPGNLETAPKGLCIEWQMPPPAPGNPLGLFGPAPDGFLIHISTLPDGLAVVGVQPKAGATKAVKNLSTTMAAGIDPWNNSAARLYGGICDLAIGGNPTPDAYKKVCDTSNEQAGKVFLIQDENTPWIEPLFLYPVDPGTTDSPTGQYTVGRTFFATASASKILGPGAKYQCIIPKEQLPLAVDWKAGSNGFADIEDIAAEPGANFTVRVRALGWDNSEDAKPEDWPNSLFHWAGSEDRGISSPIPTLRNPVPLGPGGMPIGETTAGGPYVYNKNTVMTSQTGVMSSDLPFSSLGLVGAASPPCSVDYPSETQIAFIRRVQAALALGILLRPDYTHTPTVPSILEDLGQEAYDAFSPKSYPDGTVNYPLTDTGDFESTVLSILQSTGMSSRQISGMYKTKNPMGFRRQVRRLCYSIATEMQKGIQLPDEVTQPILDETADLESWTLQSRDMGAGLTLLQSFGISAGERWGPKDKGKDETKGVGANPLCRQGQPSGVTKSKMAQDKMLSLSARSGFNIDKPQWKVISSAGAKMHATVANPALLSDPEQMLYNQHSTAITNLMECGFKMGDGTADWTPVIWDFAKSQSEFMYVRDLVTRSHPKLITQAQMVLNAAASGLTRPVPDSQWIAIRLMPNALAGADQILDAIEKFLYGILDMLQGLIDRIIAFIEGIQARIYQLQSLIEWIRSLLRSLDLFAIGPMGALVVVGSGTSGIMSEFMMAENKPADGAGAYAGGVLVTAGGIPLFLLEILALILGKEE
jgi:hypothetical protein